VVEHSEKDGREFSEVEQTILHEPLEEGGSDSSSVSGTEPQVQDVATKPRRSSPVLELANRLVEEADHLAKEETKRAEELEASRVRAEGIVQAAEWKADQLQSEVRALADNVTEEMRSALTKINDLISALTNSIDPLPAADRPAEHSHDKLEATNGTAT
jgi:cell division septum initiation protein DivIVA